jgi:hypothetical protein
MRRLGGFLNPRWGQYWQKKDEKFWKGLDEESAHIGWMPTCPLIKVQDRLLG